MRIAPHADFSLNDEVVVYWQGCKGMNGSSPIAGTYKEFPITLNETHIEKGFDLVVTDYETLIAPMVDNGSALVYYVLNKLDGTSGKSRADFVIINRTMPSGIVCSPTNEVFCPE